jgi:hypothetical protein
LKLLEDDPYNTDKDVLEIIIPIPPCNPTLFLNSGPALLCILDGALNGKLPANVTKPIDCVSPTKGKPHIVVFHKDAEYVI